MTLSDRADILVLLTQDVVGAQGPEERLASIRQMIDALEDAQREAVAAARQADVSWGRIAAAVGLKSRQAARQRFTEKAPTEDKQGPSKRDQAATPNGQAVSKLSVDQPLSPAGKPAPQSIAGPSATRGTPEAKARSESTQKTTGAVKLSVLGAEVAGVAVTLRRVRRRSVNP